MLDFRTEEKNKKDRKNRKKTEKKFSRRMTEKLGGHGVLFF